VNDFAISCPIYLNTINFKLLVHLVVKHTEYSVISLRTTMKVQYNGVSTKQISYVTCV
jgi:hypothetical protein